MPEKKVTFKPAANGTVYVYYTLRAYRNKNGKPTSDETSIGKKDPLTGMLIPNRRYFELFHPPGTPAKREVTRAKTKASLPSRVASYGNTYSLLKVAQETGLSEILTKSFSERSSQLLAVAFYMLCEGNVMMYIKDWFDETEISFAERMDDQQCSRLFASISFDERLQFFREWLKLRSEQEYLAYDVTSVSTYSQGIDIAEWGYNRDGESLAQVNLGMFYGAQSFLPVYYDLYSGSIADKSHLAFMLEGAQKLGITHTRFVMDRGFVSEDNLRYMEKNKYLFVTALPSHMTEARRIIDECKDGIRSAINRIRQFDVYACTLDLPVYGFPMKAHVYFDTEKQATDEKELYAHIDRLGAELEKMGKSSRAAKRHKDFFIIEQEKAKKMEFAPDHKKMDERLGRAGFFVLLTNDVSLNSSDVLKIYRNRHAIEKNFHQLKNDLDFRRLRTHANQTTDGKFFARFLALILRSYLLRKVKESPGTKHLTLEKVLIELRKIKTITFEDATRMLLPLTKLQRTILDALNLSTNELLGNFT